MSLEKASRSKVWMPSCHSINNNFLKDRNKIVLVGNPNSGKSVIFHKLTGIYNIVSNYPGTTLDLIKGKFKGFTVIDTPGVYGLSSLNLEEQTTRDIVCNADIIINIINSTCLERDIFLTLQLIDLGIPIIIVLNFMDDSKKQDIHIDIKKLAELLGVIIIPTIAIKNKGISELKSAIMKMDISKEKNKLSFNLLMKDKISDDNNSCTTSDKYCHHIHAPEDNLYHEIRDKADNIVSQVVLNKSRIESFKVKLGAVMVDPIIGLLIMLIILFLAYKLIGVYVAQYIVGYTEKTVMTGYYKPFIQNFIQMLSIPSWLDYFLVGEFGILTMPIIYLLGLLLPLVISFYIMLSILEDSGYLPRLAFLIDKWLTKIGLNGKAVIPLILGFGCVTMATMTTRMLDTDKERNIASVLLNFTIPCSAQLAVIAALVSTAGGGIAFIYASIIFLLFVLFGTILDKSIQGNSSSLLLSMPSLQIPGIKNILLKTYSRTKHFILEAGIWFFIGAAIISIFKMTGILAIMQNFISPIVVNWMGLPKEASIGYVMGIVRRDFGAAGFYSLSLTSIQLLVALVSITLFVPCIAAILILYKERGSKIATCIWLGTIITAFIVGGLIFNIWRLIDVIKM